MKKDWHGILKINEFKVHRGDEILYLEENIYNLLHLGGESKILSALFIGGNSGNAYIPSNYYIGLDNRISIQFTDTIDSLVGEPNGNGYARIGVPSNGSSTGFQINIIGETVAAGTKTPGTFVATTGSWGPVRNLFLTDRATNTSATLYSSVPLAQPVSVPAGTNITVKYTISLRNC